MAFDITKTYLAKRIKKTSKRKQWISFFVIIFCIFALIGQAISAMFNVDKLPELKTLQVDENDFASLITSYRFFHGDATKFEVGLPGISGTVKFYPLESGDYLPVFAPMGFQKSHSDFFYGQLTELSDEQRQEIKRQLAENYEDVDEADLEGFVQYKLFVAREEPKFDLYYTITISTVLIYSLWIFFRNRYLKKKPQSHKVFKAFARQGGELENFHQFNDEMESGKYRRFKYAILTENWLFYNGKLRLKLRNIADIVCVFKAKPLDTSIVIRWASGKRDVVVGFIDKSQWALKFKRNYALMDEFKSVLKERLPNIICDENDRETEKTWSNKPNEIIDKYSQNVYYSSNSAGAKRSLPKKRRGDIQPPETTEENTTTDTVLSPKAKEEVVKEIAYTPEPQSPPSWTRRKKK